MSSLKFACEILTEEEMGGAARIPFNIFTRLYTYLAHLDGDVPQDQIDSFLWSLKLQVYVSFLDLCMLVCVFVCVCFLLDVQLPVTTQAEWM